MASLPALYQYQTTVCNELSSGHPSSYSDSGHLEASLPLLQFCPIFLLSTFLSGKTQAQIFKVLASPGLGFRAPEAFVSPLLPGSRGSPPPLVFFFFFHLPTLLEVNTFLYVAFQLFSLYVSGQICSCSG